LGAWKREQADSSTCPIPFSLDGRRPVNPAKDELVNWDEGVFSIFANFVTLT
jgi:hypothetical protein